MLQEVSASDGVTPVGAPQQILDRIDDDGPLVEAPNLVATSDGSSYVLFYSSHCYDDPAYDVKYAVATSVAGPYERRGQLLTTGDYGLTSPGGATATPAGDVLLFHANCDGTTDGSRCLHTVDISISAGGAVTLDA